MPNTNPEPSSTARELADQLMLDVLRRARDGKLRRGETERVRAVMAAFKDWSDSSQRCELIERATEIAAIGREIGAQARNLPNDMLERTKRAISEAVAEAVRAAIKQELTKAKGRTRNASARK